MLWVEVWLTNVRIVLTMSSWPSLAASIRGVRPVSGSLWGFREQETD
jgi:hypothetical protein